MFRAAALFSASNDRLECLGHKKDARDQEKAEFDFDGLESSHWTAPLESAS